VLDASLILLVLFLVAVGITFSVIRMAWLGRRDRVSQPCCAACRYKVRGLQSWTCPECGSDLREVGILTRGLRVVRSISTFEMIALWTSMIGTIAVLSIAGLGSLTQFRRLAATPGSVVCDAEDRGQRRSTDRQSDDRGNIPAERDMDTHQT